MSESSAQKSQKKLLVYLFEPYATLLLLLDLGWYVYKHTPTNIRPSHHEGVWMNNMQCKSVMVKVVVDTSKYIKLH